MNFEPRLPKEGINGQAQHQLKDFLILGLAMVMLMGGLFLALHFGSRFWIQRLSPESAQNLRGKLAGLADVPTNPMPAEMQAYFDDLLSRSRLAHPKLFEGKFQVLLSCDKHVNALALPQGGIVFYRGLLEKMPSENALAFVLGHELGHFKRRHHLRSFSSSLALASIVAMALPGEFGSILGSDRVQQLLNMHFSRRQETEADDSGLDMIQELYGHGGGVLAAMTVLGEASSAQGGDWLPQFISSHPHWRDRQARMESRLKTKDLKEREPTPLPKWSFDAICDGKPKASSEQ